METEKIRDDLSREEIKTLGRVQKKLGLTTKTRISLRERLLEWDPADEEEASASLLYKWLTFGFFAVGTDFIFRSELTLVAVAIMSYTYWMLALLGTREAAISTNETKKPVRFLMNHENLRYLVSESKEDGWFTFLFGAVSVLLIADGMWYVFVEDAWLLFVLNFMAVVMIFMAQNVHKASRATIAGRITKELLSWQSVEEDQQQEKE